MASTILLHHECPMLAGNARADACAASTASAPSALVSIRHALERTDYGIGWSRETHEHDLVVGNTVFNTGKYARANSPNQFIATILANLRFHGKEGSDWDEKNDAKLVLRNNGAR